MCRYILARVRQGAASDLMTDELTQLRAALTQYVGDLDDEIVRRPVEENLLAAHPEWMCSIGHSVMRDPVLAADGHVYERKKLSLWMRRSRREGAAPPGAGAAAARAATWKSPMTGLSIADFTLTAKDDLRCGCSRRVQLTHIA